MGCEMNETTSKADGGRDLAQALTDARFVAVVTLDSEDAAARWPNPWGRARFATAGKSLCPSWGALFAAGGIELASAKGYLGEPSVAAAGLPAAPFRSDPW